MCRGLKQTISALKCGVIYVTCNHIYQKKQEHFIQAERISVIQYLVNTKSKEHMKVVTNELERSQVKLKRPISVFAKCQVE